jgi:integrase
LTINYLQSRKKIILDFYTVILYGFGLIRGKTMKNTDLPAWTKTNVPNLYRHANRRYYARIFLGGGENWKSLKTKLKSVAEERLKEYVGSARQLRSTGNKLAKGNLTVEWALELYRQNFQRDAELAERTKHFREEGIQRLLKTWPGLDKLQVRKITPAMVREWALRMRSEGQPYIPKGAKRPLRTSSGVSATAFNSALDALKHTLDTAVQAGYLFVNPALDKGIKRATPKPKRLLLPTRAQFQAIIQAIEKAGCGECRAAAEMARFLAYTGARHNEAINVQWRDIDLVHGRITLRVTKNGHPRDVHMIPECRALIETMKQEHTAVSPTTSLLRVKACLGFLEKACQEVGAPRMTHHDLRHLFATTAIESGMDIPTVAKIMGHQDGGALAMKVYGHLRDEHAKAAMQRVSFGPVLPVENVVEFQQEASAVG